MFWEDHSCSGISQCKLNKAILHVAMKCIEKDSHECNGSFLMLATKVLDILLWNSRKWNVFQQLNVS